MSAAESCLWCGTEFRPDQLDRRLQPVYCSMRCRTDAVGARAAAIRPGRSLPTLTPRQSAVILAYLRETAATVDRRIRLLEETSDG